MLAEVVVGNDVVGILLIIVLILVILILLKRFL